MSLNFIITSTGQLDQVMVQGNGLTLVVNLSELSLLRVDKVQGQNRYQFQVLVDVRLGRSDNEHNRLLQDQKTRKSLRGKECLCVLSNHPV